MINLSKTPDEHVCHVCRKVIEAYHFNLDYHTAVCESCLIELRDLLNKRFPDHILLRFDRIEERLARLEK